MAKKSAVEKNVRRAKLVRRLAAKRARLKEIARDKSLPMEERFDAQLRLAALPRDSAPSRTRNRCEISGRPRSVYRKFKLSRIALRKLAASGQIPGMTKSSW